MKSAMILMLSLVMILSFNSQEKSGVKIAVKQEVIYGFEKQFLPLLVEELGHVEIPDAQFDVDVGISTLHIFLSEIHFKLNNLLAENIIISLHEPDVVNVKANSITGAGNLKVFYKLGFLKETDIVKVMVNNVNIDAEAILTTQESKQVPGKLLPSANISHINIDLDFDFHVDGSFIAFVANLVKSIMKNYIHNQIISKLKEIVLDESKMLFDDLANQLPVYVPLGYKGLVIDYSLISPPKISNGYLLVNSNGAIINLDSKSSRELPFSSTEMPDYDENGKSIQMFLSEYSIDTAINTLYESNLFEVTINPEDIPKDSPIQLNTSYLSILISGLSDYYGTNRPVRIYARVSEIPKFEISKHLVDASVITELTFYVLLDSGEWDEALKFSTNVLVSGDATVQTQGQISAHIHTIELSQSKMIETKIKDVNLDNFEIFFNLSTKYLIPILNETFLKNITVKLPTIEGISFEDSTVDIPANYVEMNVNPKFEVNLIHSYLQRRKVLLQTNNNLLPLFLN